MSLACPGDYYPPKGTLVTQIHNETDKAIIAKNEYDNSSVCVGNPGVYGPQYRIIPAGQTGVIGFMSKDSGHAPHVHVSFCEQTSGLNCGKDLGHLHIRPLDGHKYPWTKSCKVNGEEAVTHEYGNVHYDSCGAEHEPANTKHFFYHVKD